MELESSSLYREINKIVSSPSKPVHHVYSAKIHVKIDDNTVNTYEPLKVLSIDYLSDYENNYCDEIVVRLVILGGTYAKRIYPYKDNVDITLTRIPLVEGSDNPDINQQTQTEKYTAILVDTGNPLVEGNGANIPSEEALNLTNIFEVSFQLINKAAEQLRAICVGGVYRNATVEDVIKGVLTKESMNLNIDKEYIPKGVDMVEASNKSKRDHIVIPQGTSLVDIPYYVDRKCGGVYSSGTGYYLQHDFWYLYPCFDTTRFDKATNTLTVLNIPTNKFPNIERTYRLDGNNLVILATGNVQFNDDSENQQLNYGNGVRFSDANRFMTGFTETSDNKTIAIRGNRNNEYVSAQRANGINIVKTSGNPINANPYLESSKLARRQGSVFTFIWENSNSLLIYPGMMVKILYMDNNDISQIFGVVLRAHHYVGTKQKGLLNSRHTSRTALSIFVKRPT